MKSYFRVMLGQGGMYTAQCVDGGVIGVDYEMPMDLSQDLPDQWRVFNQRYIPIYLKGHPGKTKIAAGLACGTLWTVAKGIKEADEVLCPDGSGRYRVGELTGGYYYEPGGVLPHRRPVKWLDQAIDRADMSEALRGSTGSYGTVVNVTSYRDEIERLITGQPAAPIVATEEGAVEDYAAFAMESHLEDFLVQNWPHTDLGQQYDIFTQDGVLAGKQYMTDTGPLDILAVSKDQKTLLVLELKKGRASDAVVGQTLRYMGYVKEQLAEPGQAVEGAIIALEDDQRIRRALSVMPNIAFYRYQINFKLLKS